MSATLNAEEFSQYFGKLVKLNITFSIKDMYSVFQHNYYIICSERMFIVSFQINELTDLPYFSSQSYPIWIVFVTRH